MRKITLHLAPVNGGAFNCLPARDVELDPEMVLCNDVTLPWDFNPHNTRLWVIGHEFGALCAVWAQHEGDALDEMVDKGLGDCFLVPEEDRPSMTPEEWEQCSHLGNAGEPANLDNAWLQVVQWDKARDCEVLCKFAEARGANADNLDQ